MDGRRCQVPVLLLLLLAAAPTIHADCRLRLSINPQQSHFTFSGTNLLVPTTGALPPAPLKDDNTITKGFSGNVYLSAPSLSACPTTATAWLAALPQFTLNSTAPYMYTPIHLWPPSLNGTTAGISPFNLQSVSISLTATITSVDAATSSFKASLTPHVLQAWLWTSNIVTGTRYDDISNVTSTTTSVTGNITFQGTQLLLNIPDFAINFTTLPATIILASGTSAASTSSVQVRGNMLLQGETACTRYCGDQAECVVANGTAGCQCDCGWAPDASGACLVPSGFCSTGNSSVGALPPTSNPAPSQATTAIQGSCPAGSGLTGFGTQCTRCTDGFAGTNCATCQSDSACQALSSSSDVQCVRDATYRTHSTNKNYTCQVSDSQVSSLLGDALQFTCSTLPPSDAATQFTGVRLSVTAGILSATTSAVGTTPYCTLTFRMPTFTPGAYTRCTGWGCSFYQGSSSVSCSVVQCQCPDGCTNTDGTDMRPTFEGVSGSIDISCDMQSSPGAAQTCRVGLNGLPIDKVQVSCTTSECYDPQAPVNLGNTPIDDVKGPVVSDPVIAALPIMALLAVCAAAAAAMAATAPYILTGRLATKPRPPTSNTRAPQQWGTGAYSLVSNPQPIAEGTESDRVGASPGTMMQYNSLGNGLGVSTASMAHSSGPVHPSAGILPAQSITLPIQQQNAAQLQNTYPVAEELTAHGANGAGAASCVLEPKLQPVISQELHPQLHFSFLDISVTSTHRSLSSCARPPGSRQQASQLFEQQEDGIKRGSLDGVTHILHSISGSASVYEVLGVLGPSGSGKSTLLNVLSGQISTGGTWHVGGTVRLCGQELSPKQLCHATAFVAQHDTLLLRFLTVEEALRCSAALRLGAKATPQHVADKVEQVLQELHVAHLRDKRSHRGTLTLLSGGERQRVSIGMELVTDPQLLLLDEPTSGLDSFNAREVLSTLRAIASKGRIVITSLHQPSPVLFNMLDKALLITEGHAVFSGPPKEAAGAFQALGLPCPSDHFIAEHMLEVVGDPALLRPLLGHIASTQFKAAHNRVVVDQDAQYMLQQPPSSGSGRNPNLDQHSNAPSTEPLAPSQQAVLTTAHVPFVRRMGVLAWRSALEATRNPMLILLHWVFAIALGLIVGFVYFKSANDTSGAQNRVGALFFVLNLFGSISVTAIDLIQQERQVVERELVRRLYPWWLHMGLKLAVDGLLLRLLPGAVFCALYYWLMGLRHTAQAFTVFLFVFCTFNCLVGALALLCACVMGTPGRAVMTLMSVLLLSALFSGFLVNKGSISWVLRWLTYISPYRFSWEALVVNELQPMVLTLTAPGLPPVPPVKGRLFLGLLGVDPDALTTDIIVLDCMYVILVIGSMAGMALRLHLLRTGRA